MVPDRRWQRHGGIAPQPRGVLQYRRLSSVAGPGAPGFELVVAVVGLGADGADQVADLALFLSAIAGPDLRSPLSIAEDGARFRAPLARSFKGTRIAWWKGLGGIPVEEEIRRVIDGTQKVFADMGCLVQTGRAGLHRGR
jgi:hypothetical protein